MLKCRVGSRTFEPAEWRAQMVCSAAARLIYLAHVACMLGGIEARTAAGDTCQKCDVWSPRNDRGGREGVMGTYGHIVDTLERELTAIEQTYRNLTDEDWQRSTRLQPLDPSLKLWTIFELAGHFDISIGLTRMLIADPQPGGQPGRDRVSFFIFPRSEVAPVVYDYAYKMVEGKSPADMPDVLHETFSKTIAEARANPPDTIGPGYYALMRLDEFVASRVVEAVVHGLDLTDALGLDELASDDAVTIAADILDDLLARRTVRGRPADLSDNRDWVRAASGRAEHNDPRLPLIG